MHAHSLFGSVGRTENWSLSKAYGQAEATYGQCCRDRILMPESPSIIEPELDPAGKRPSEFELGSDGGCDVVFHERRQREKREVERKSKELKLKGSQRVGNPKWQARLLGESVRDVIEESRDRVQVH